VRHAGFDGLARHLPAVAVEERQFAARFAQAAGKVAPLRLGRPRRVDRDVRTRFTARSISAFAHSAVPLTMINGRLRSQFQSAN
jgi:hypothetical protein